MFHSRDPFDILLRRGRHVDTQTPRHNYTARWSRGSALSNSSSCRRSNAFHQESYEPDVAMGLHDTAALVWRAPAHFSFTPFHPLDVQRSEQTNLPILGMTDIFFDKEGRQTRRTAAKLTNLFHCRPLCRRRDRYKQEHHNEKPLCKDWFHKVCPNTLTIPHKYRVKWWITSLIT